MYQRVVAGVIICLILSKTIKAQQTNRVVHEQCATMERLQLEFKSHPGLKTMFEEERIAFTKAVHRRAILRSDIDNAGSRTSYTIPVVFHIVSTNPELVSDDKIQAVLDTLNKDFSGSNEDSVKIPSYFKPLFGKSGIQFCLAQRTPEGEATKGIERIITTQTTFIAGSDDVKNVATLGANSWDTKRYLNVWLCILSNNVLGYSTFPGDVGTQSENQGVVIDYRTLPGGSLTNYNKGKTLTHETGHFFNLYHIWGDDKGACTGSDFVDDTPNQADATSSCYTGIKTDSCTPGGSGVMYQNYMDYTYDNCMVMFTVQQVIRMETALLTYRSSLLNSNACTPPVIRNYDVRLSSIDEPLQRLCSSSFSPVITFKNIGRQPLTSLKISSKIDNGIAVNYDWKGMLEYLKSVTVSLNSLQAPEGIHTLTIYVSNPNNNPDEDVTNDTLSTTFQFYNPVADVFESFEFNTFPPPGWDIVNPDNGITWKRVTGIAKTGQASVSINNYNYNIIGERDDLRLPTVTLQNVDSAFLSFQVAAAVYTDPNARNITWDTLQVLASTDCGKTYTSLYKKYGNELITRSTATTTSFSPRPSEWRKDSINVGNYIGKGNVLFTIRNTTGYENNIYLDDIQVRTVIINPNLKRRGFLVTPNPTNGAIAVQFYPQPTNLKSIQLYNMAGQKLQEIIVADGSASNYYRFDLSRFSAGTYIVRVIFSDRVVTNKVLKF